MFFHGVVNGTILLGGFCDQFKTEAAVAFRSKGVSIVRAHGKRSVVQCPFTHYTASLQLASKLSRVNTVVVTSSWIDVLISIVGASSLGELGRRPAKNVMKELNSWVVISRMLDRVALRYGALYFIDRGAADIADAVFPGFSERPGVLVCEKGSTLDDVLIASSFSQCLHPSTESMNLNGNIADADYILVGDKINRVFKHFDHWPFHDDAASAFFITSLLQFLGIPEAKLAWTNANHSDEAIRSLLKTRNPKVIALGQEAFARLKAIGITPEFSIPHPSWARRFNKRDEYLSSLATIFQSDNPLRLLTAAQASAVSP